MHETLKINHFSVLFGAIYSTCVVYTKTIIDLRVGESGGFLPHHFAAQQISTKIHLHLSEQLLNRKWQQRGQVVRVSDLKSCDLELKYSFDHQLDLLYIVCTSTSQLCLYIVGILNLSSLFELFEIFFPWSACKLASGENMAFFGKCLVS